MRNMNFLKTNPVDPEDHSAAPTQPTGAASNSSTHWQGCDEAGDDIHVGAWVEIFGLSSVRGKGLNGITGEVTSVGKRVGVHIHEENKTVSILRANLEVVGSNFDEEPEWADNYDSND